MKSIGVVGGIVLNLIITGIPSILEMKPLYILDIFLVLNLIITGIPSIPDSARLLKDPILGFKPYYIWKTFNTSMIE